MIVVGRGKIRLLQWSDTRYINHTTGLATCSGVVGQYKLDFFFSVFFFHFGFLFVFFLRKRKNTKLGRLEWGRDLGGVGEWKRI